MTKKDYIAITKCIKAQREVIQTENNCRLDALVEDLEVYFKQDNSRFDSDKFREASGYNI